MRELVISQLIALVAFFAFPILQYLWLRILTSKEGELQLWYLPAYGFRLVARNLPRKKKYSDISYRTVFREYFTVNQGASVRTYVDTLIQGGEEFFLFPGSDQVIFSFKIVGENENSLKLVYVDKLGTVEHLEIPFWEFDRLIFDFKANMENIFNFDIKLGKRGEISVEDLIRYWREININNAEQRFQLSRIRNVG